MKLTKKILVSIAAATCMGSFAYAQDSEGGLFVEPMITYEDGDTEINYPAPLSNSSGESNGWGVGARLGLHVMESFFIGADGRYFVHDFKDSAFNYNEKATGGNLGPVVGFQMPEVGLRLWGTYVLTGELNPEASGNSDVRFKEANGYRVGAGFHVGSISLNAEYQDLKYNKTDVEDGGGVFAPGTTFDNVELESKSWILSLSFPMEL